MFYNNNGLEKYWNMTISSYSICFKSRFSDLGSFCYLFSVLHVRKAMSQEQERELKLKLLNNYLLFNLSTL
jgi:hypothetical protein